MDAKGSASQRPLSRECPCTTWGNPFFVPWRGFVAVSSAEKGNRKNTAHYNNVIEFYIAFKNSIISYIKKHNNHYFCGNNSFCFYPFCIYFQMFSGKKIPEFLKKRENSSVISPFWATLFSIYRRREPSTVLAEGSGVKFSFCRLSSFSSHAYHTAGNLTVLTGEGETPSILRKEASQAPYNPCL